MPKRTDIKSILVIGAGPIVIGQGCEFDYAGAQACKALKEDGFRVILVNSNPATIMTDPQMADAIYIEPIQWGILARIIEKERPDAILPTMGGQTALNCALDLVRQGILKQFNVELIGANQAAIDKAEDREQFRQAMKEIGLAMPKSVMAHSLESAKMAQAQIGFPTIIRPSFTLGGSGGGIAYNFEEFEEICKRGLDCSPTHELLIEQSIIGWKEFEMEVVRDKNDNCIIVCAIENVDAMGIHTGDSITVAPAQTLTDKEYQRMRDAAIAVLRKIGVETGGSNVQFAICPKTGELHVIEMNPRVSRSSALASKATGFPIAKVAAKLAVGYTLDELANEITQCQTPASFEPTIDYVVTKIPRFNFEKFPQADPILTTQMKSVGEVMAIGRTFQESLQKAIRGLEVGLFGLESVVDITKSDAKAEIRQNLQRPSWQRLWYIGDAFRLGFDVQDIYQLTHIDPWFLAQIQDLVQAEKKLSSLGFGDINKTLLLQLKRKGFSDHRLAELLGIKEQSLRKRRHELGVRPVYKRVDSCAAEFSVETAYLYSTYEEECEALPNNNKKIMVLGGGPNRIGQGIEFDYCCVHAAQAMREEGFETIMVNCNPETVSTDYDTSDRLYFEPLTLEDVLEIVHLEKPQGVIVQFGGQTPLKLAKALASAGVPIIGTCPDAIDRAEDRGRFQQMINRLNLLQPPNGMAATIEEALIIANSIGYPLIVRPSYVLGGRAMEVVYSDEELRDYMQRQVNITKDSPILLDRFLDDAIEVDVDAVCDGDNVLIGGIMEHIEQAGVHSGDSACSLPPFSLSEAIQNQLRDHMRKMAKELAVVGLINAQFAIKDNQIYVLEVNPRAARTVPFISKVIGVSLAKIAACCMVGKNLKAQKMLNERIPEFYAVKKSVFPFEKFPGVDPILGPEMRSTGEVMGVGNNFAQAYAKSELATLAPQISSQGYALISVRDADKSGVIEIARKLQQFGFKLLATRGTAQALTQAGLQCDMIRKMNEGRPHIVDSIKNDKIAFIINTTEGRQAIADSNAIRRNAVMHKVCYTTTLSGARAQVLALSYQKDQPISPIQDLHLRVKVK
ncbi:MAG: carbamoyl-phosphate synthase large subunit [Proteobacteria bacterium]|nr:carbamoyl-phosphate synthase large subunit [Pseudomonadota bacterium]